MKTDSFALRHLGPRDHDLPKMLETIGVETLDQLINETIPSDIRLKKPLDLEHIMTEYEYANHIRLLGRTNKVYKSYIGLGYHQQLFPPIQRNILKTQDGTLLTPYQAEIAQGRLEAILNFQTTVIELTGMEIPMHHY
jgi:glycine dehydrogenase